MIKIESYKVWDRKCQEINMYIKRRKCSKIWNFIRKVKNLRRDKAYKVIKLEKWNEHYKNLLKETR